MKRSFLVICTCLLFLWPAALALPKTADNVNLTVHEWGTFTSVAGADGLPTPWQSYGNRRDDLPCFVNSFGGFKFETLATVRMETPVLYFYGQRDTVLDVRVSFPNGTITEWYPQRSNAPREPAGFVAWSDVRVKPDAKESFPRGGGPSHYYTARQTDAAPLQVGDEQEKFLFYRGIGTFPLPLSAQVTQDGNIALKRLSDGAVGRVILFENRGGKRRYLLTGPVDGEMTLDRSSLQENWAGLLMDLERALIDNGLYQKEAHAMIETWRDSWFEEGTRLFYIVPRKSVDSILPLSVQPQPAQTARVFVGRMEIITPEIQDDVRQALAVKDASSLEKYGRFLQPIAKRMGAASPFLNSVYESYSKHAASCSR
jgi:hypothetical protein